MVPSFTNSRIIASKEARIIIKDKNPYNGKWEIPSATAEYVEYALFYSTLI
jgi:hypothetical protein